MNTARDNRNHRRHLRHLRTNATHAAKAAHNALLHLALPTSQPLTTTRLDLAA